jgi:DNA repair photolyase
MNTIALGGGDHGTRLLVERVSWAEVFVKDFPDCAIPVRPRKGRGAVGNPAGRFETLSRVAEDDGWFREAQSESLRTTLEVDTARSVISRNSSPDVPFEQSVNPYRGCEHGCVYCFARPTHAYLGLSPGLDFETRLFHKPDAPERLAEELSGRGYRCRPIALGINTDAYQPVERRTRLTRRLLEVCADHNQPVSIVTKSGLIERDLDLLAPMAARSLVQVMVSVTTLDNGLARRLEPRATAPAGRLRVVAALRQAGVPVGVLCAPIIPLVNDAEIEAILEAARDVGVIAAGYVMLRLPHEVKDLFREWLHHHVPLRADHVMSVLQQMRGGRDYESTFGARMRGRGPFADLVAQRFALASRRCGLDRGLPPLDCSRFRVPARQGDQLALF